MATHGNWSSAVYRVHVEGRTPGCSGKGPMVTMVGALPSATTYVGSHHEAVYLAAITAMSDALRAGHANLAITVSIRRVPPCRPGKGPLLRALV